MEIINLETDGIFDLSNWIDELNAGGAFQQREQLEQLVANYRGPQYHPDFVFVQSTLSAIVLGSAK